MKLARYPELRDILAARYALGVLRGGARRRFEAMQHVDPDLRALAAQWQQHLVGLAEAVPPVAVPARVWRGLERRIPTLARTPVRRNWFHSLAMWRATAGLAALVAAVSIGIAWFGQVQEQKTAVAAKGATASMGAAYVATFTDPKTGRAVALVYADAGGHEVSFQVLDTSLVIGPDQIFELWTAAPVGQGMLPAGLVPANPGGGVQRFPVPDAETLRGASLIGLSLEPVGGSPAPTHVVGVARWVRIET